MISEEKSIPDSGGTVRPGASIVVVTYNSQKTIVPCFESLMRCTDSEDEVIVVDNASQDATVELSEKFTDQYPGRIILIKSEKNLGFSQGTNLGLDLASKEFVVLVNPDVEVTTGWLDRMLAYLVSDPRVGAVGPTSDFVAGLQKVGLYLSATQFSSWDSVSDTLAQLNYGKGQETRLLIGFCLAARRSVLRELGNLDSNLFLGNDDLDLSLRLRQKGLKLLVATDVFVHHFGQVSFSTEPGKKTKYLVQQSTNALYEKIFQKYKGKIPPPEDLWGISWFTPQKGLASIVITIQNNLDLARECIASVYNHTARQFQLILVDDGSTGDVFHYAEQLNKSFGNVLYIRNDKNQGYAYAINQGIAVSSGDYVVLLEASAIVSSGWLGRLLALFAVDPAIGLVGPATEYRTNMAHFQIDYTQGGAGFDELAAQHYLNQAGKFENKSLIKEACLVLTREAVKKIGGLDTGYRKSSLAKDDFCLRLLRGGFEIASAQDVLMLQQLESNQTRTSEDLWELEKDQQIFCHKWNYNGKLTHDYPAIELARARAFNPELDYVPPQATDIFRRSAKPLELETTKPARFLLIPELDNPGWLEVVELYITTFKPVDPVSLIVRLEPPSTENLEGALKEINVLLLKLGLTETDIPDIILEASNISPRYRGGLYTAAIALLAFPDGSERYIREAQGCGLPVVEKVTGDLLRRLASSSSGQKDNVS